MAISYQHPKVKVHIGDGFKFLDDYKNEFDVIITDSSDPDGPAQTLFQKPYFKLLEGALREGGVISTQCLYIPFRSCALFRCRHEYSLLIPRNADYNTLAENQWLHLPLITQIKKDCREVFPVAEFAFTTIPTYPSGQIGFMICTKDANRNVKVPLRSFTAEQEESLLRYYNADVHEAAFKLPTFARKALQ